MKNELKIGDKVTRMLGGIFPMILGVTNITDERIVCGMWEFDKTTGIEIDDEISVPVSYLVL